MIHFKSKLTRLSIFETFKTKNEELTGEAIRQRNIISHLAIEDNPSLMTRTAIAQDIAKKNNLLWKNIYSGIFRDLDEVLIPLEIVVESGRLPIKRGPKALQEKGIPSYKLATKGLLVALSITELKNKKQVLGDFLSRAEITDQLFSDSIKLLEKISPKFTYTIFENYVKAYCTGKLKNLLPINISEFKKISKDNFTAQREMLEGFMLLSKASRIKILNLFKI